MNFHFIGGFIKMKITMATNYGISHGIEPVYKVSLFNALRVRLSLTKRNGRCPAS